MATLTIRNVPDDVVERLKTRAKSNGRSMEQELRELLRVRYPSKEAAIASMRESWKTMPTTSKEEIDKWLDETRNRPV
jgi:plasmid stability protein